jgi:predicted enzyme related to lactoylglutathione lyase
MKPARPKVHISIDVPDLDAGLRFYGEVFGFVETARPFPTMAVLDANNVSVCMHAKAADTKSSSAGTERRRYERHWTPVHLDLHVEDFDAVVDKVRAQGGAIENEFRQGKKPAAFCSDPFGNGFCVIGERAD